MKLNVRPPAALWSTKRRKIITSATATVVVIAAITGLVLGLTSNTSPTIHYTNISRNYRVCLLTTSNDTQTDTVWKAVQAAAANAPINAQHVTAPDGTTEALQPYINSLIAMKCQLIVAPGTELTDPANTAAKTAPNTHFVIATNHPTLPNVTALPASLHTLTTMIKDATKNGK